MTAAPSYSVPASICMEAAHCWPRPWVPIPIVTTGRAPLPVHLPVGSITVPVTATGVSLLGLGLVDHVPGFVAGKRDVEVDRRRAILDQFAVVGRRNWVAGAL